VKTQILDLETAQTDRWKCFTAILNWRAHEHSSRTAVTLLDVEGCERQNVSFDGLNQRARSIAAFLQKERMEGERALILLPSGPDFVSTFLGCLYAGAIAVPAFPFHFDGARRGASCFNAVAADSGAKLAFATPEMIEKLPSAANNPLVSALQWLSPGEIPLSWADEWSPPHTTEDAIAFLQYTSGSTFAPKGVMISNGNLLNNMKVIQAACGMGEDSTVVTWLPLFHDMGLIGTVLQPLYVGASCVLMAPTTFLQKPVRWLQAISKYRAYSSSAPNFAYELCARKISCEDKAGLDLSSWQVAVNGAEPVRQETMERFAEAFSECGFRAEAFHPSYGLAEATLMVSGGKRAPGLFEMHVSVDGLEHNLVLEPSGDEPAKILAGCGGILADQELRIVDPEKLEECQKGRIGEIWLASPSVAKGYWNRSEETKETFHAQLISGGDTRFLRTGDLGFLAQEQLFITGRLKDLVILNGRNLYPHDIELTVQQAHHSLRFGAGAAFAIEVDGQELLAVVNEVDRHSGVPHDALILMIRNAVLLEHGIQIHSLALLRPGSIPKTTSGKIKRAACRAALLAGELQILTSSTLPLNGPEPVLSAGPANRMELLQTDPGLRIQWVESHLRQLIAEITKIDPHRMGSDQSFVGIGLDSLGSTKLAERIEREFGVYVDVTSLLEGLNLSGLVRHIVERVGDTADTQLGSGRSPKSHSWTLSHGQKGLWVLHQVAPNSVAYTLFSAVRVTGRLDFVALQKAFSQLMERHPMLRAIFTTIEGEPTQIIQPTEEISLPRHISRTELSQAESEHLHDRLTEEVQKPFRLEEAPPVRLLVFSLPSGDDVLMLLLHHIIADLWSIETILEDLNAAYLAQRYGHAASLPELSLDYSDFVSWQSSHLEGPMGESLLKYWRNQLSGDSPILQLPADRPRPPIFSYRGASEPLSLGVDLYQSLLSLARRENITPFMLLAAAFQLLLHRVSAQEELLLGTPVSGRRQGFGAVIGYFVNPIVVRSFYHSSILFTDFLAQSRHTILQAFKHQDYPFPLLVERLRPKRDGAASPIFQSMFVWQELPGSQGQALAAASLGAARVPLHFGEAPADLVPLENGGSQFDLTLLMSATTAGLLGSLKYSTDLFDRATIHRLAKQFSAVLAAIAENPHRQLFSLPLMTSEERQQLLVEFGAGRSTPYGGHGLIHELFERQAENDPSAVALIVGDKELTFAQLNAQANQFARYLQGLEVQAESLVGVCLQRSAEMIAGLLGIWKAGGVYVPFDVRDPQPRLAAMMERIPLTAVITHENLLDRLPEQLPPIVMLDLDLDLIAQEDDSNVHVLVNDNSLAYVIHTSGSTGTPKGVMIEHRCLKNLLDGLSGSIYASLDRKLKVALNAPFTFDSSIKQLVVLAMGHTLCVIPEEMRRNGPELLAYIKEMRLDVFDCTPTQFDLLLDAGLEKSDDSVAFLVAGEPISDRVWDILQKRAGRTSFNLYGPTECTVDASVAPIAPGTEVSIGRPLSGTDIYILDQNLEPTPIGAPGEIFIGGHSVGRGYLGRPDLTAEKFLPDPFSSETGTRMYRTGDQARWLNGGNIRFTGRVDRQMKIRGFRIEPGEIEAALRLQDGVQDAAVVATTFAGGATQLVGYINAFDEKPSSHYRQLLARILPDYMIPSVFVNVAEIPVTAHGKRNYAALPPVDPGELNRDDFTPHRSVLEEHLVNMWISVLRVQRVGVHDNFFSLGGDSLQATKLVAQVQQEYPSDTPLLALFFQDPTIASLARFIESRQEVSVS